MTRRLAVRGLAIGFVVIVAVLHVMRPDVSPMQRGISRYANGSTLILMTVAFAVLAAAIAVAASAARSWLLGIAAISLLVVAAFPDPNSPPARSLPHTAAGLVFFVTVAAGLYTSHRSSGRAARSLIILPLLFLASEAGVPLLALVPGILQRCCFAAIALAVMTLPALDRSPQLP